MRFLTAVLASGAFVATTAQADIITVAIEGTVGFNTIGEPPLSGVGSGESALMSFTVDSNDFVEGVPGDTRGYVIDQGSFSLAFGGGVSVGLLNPFPNGQTPYFTLVDGFPVSDGFFVSTSPFSPGGVPLEQEPYNTNLELGYEGDTLSSLDILDAVGEYDFDGLTRFGFTIWNGGPDNVRLEMEFARLTITPAPPVIALLAPFGLLATRRRRG